MASAKFEGGKHKGGTAAKAQFRHDVQDTRLKDNHSNEELDKAKTPLNTAINGFTYEELCKRYDDRIETLDATSNRNRRKDRVTMVSVVLPVPDDLLPSQVDSWYMEAWKIAGQMWGDDNLLELTVHRDEEHEYTDPETREKRMSKVHGHLMFIPEADGQLNAKWATSRANIIEFNKQLEDMSLEKFKVHFMDGSRKKGKLTVEELKKRSREVEELERREMELKRSEAALRAAQDKFQETRELQQVELQSRLKRLQGAEKAVSDREAAVAELEAAASRREAIASSDRKLLEYLKTHKRSKEATESLYSHYLEKMSNNVAKKQEPQKQPKQPIDRLADAEKLTRGIDWSGYEKGGPGYSM